MNKIKYSMNLFFWGCILFSSSCNPVSENIEGNLWTSLHPSKPFTSENFHGADYRFPSGACDENQCHGADLTGGNSGAPSCFRCHGNIWTVFSTTHTLKVSGHYHHRDTDDYPADRSSNADWFLTCRSCHGADLGGVSGYNYSSTCKSCHSGFTALIPPPGHRKNEEGYAWHHYNYEEDSGIYCSGDACHGADGESEGTAAGAFAGIASHGPACSQCHNGDD